MTEIVLIQFLERLTPADLTRILTRIPDAANYVPQGVSHLERVSALLLYVRSSGGPGLNRLEEIIQELFPGKFPILGSEPANKPMASQAPSSVELRRLMTERLNRSEIGTLWFDLFGTTLDNDMPGRPHPDCVVELLARASSRRRLDALRETLARAHPHVLDTADPR